MSEEKKHPYLDKVVAWRTEEEKGGRLVTCPVDHPDASLFDVYYPGVESRGILSSGDHSFDNEYDAMWISLMVKASFEAGIEHAQKEMREMLGVKE